MGRRFRTSLLTAVAVATMTSACQAGPLRERIREHLAERADQSSPRRAGAITIAYGPDAAQRFDLYQPPGGKELAPVIVMVHGGGWKYGDKSMSRVIDNKLAHWGGKGFMLASVNYRMLPTARPDEQARDVARAIAKIEAEAPAYGGDPHRLIVMGHSAGGHLLALLSADPSLAAAQGAAPWRASVILDAGALDVTTVMSEPHAGLYDGPFGKDPAYWRSVSPMDSITPQALPMMLVCSLPRPDDSCGQSKAFAARLSQRSGQTAPVQPEPLSHREINESLGQPGAYTDAVDAFIVSQLER